MSCTEGKKAFKARDSERRHITITCPWPRSYGRCLKFVTQLSRHSVQHARAVGASKFTIEGGNRV